MGAYIMKKILLSVLTLFLINSICLAKDTLQFDFPNEGWHKVASPDGVESKKCYVPYNQTADNYTEMLIFSEKILKNKGLSPMVMLHKQLGKDRNNFIDIVPEYIVRDFDNSMVTWCSQLKNTCAVSRAFQGNQGVVFATYINKAPHYSQNMFGQWSNILSKVKVYAPVAGEKLPNNLIELD